MAERGAGRTASWTAARVVASLALLAALAYACLCALMWACQRDLVYHPGLTRVPAADTDFVLARDGIHLRGWQVNPGRDDAVIYFGGNAERIEAWREPFAQWFGGRSVYLVAYRGYGASDGTPDEQALRADALALYDAVHARHPGGRVAVVGRSLGSGVAAWVASQRPVDRLALVTPFDGLAQVGQAHYPWLPVRWLARERWPSAELLARYHGPLLVLRAGRDAVVPPASTDRLLAALPGPVQVVDFPDADHNDLSDDPRYGQALSGFME